MTDFNVRDTETLPLIIESIARRVVAVERRSPQFTEAVSVVEVQDLDSRPDPEGPDSYCYVVLTADWYETSANGFLPPPNPPIPVYQWVTSTGPPVVPPTPTPLPDPLLISDGTAAAPSLAFTTNPDTGIYRVASDVIGFTTAGSATFRMDTVNLRGNVNNTASMPGKTAGTEALPAYAFVNDTDTGMYRHGANEVGFATAGTENLRLTGSNLRMASATSVIYNTGYFRGVAATGTAASPTYSWDGDTDTGMYRSGTNQIGFSAGNSTKFKINTAGVEVIGTSTLNGQVSGTGIQTISTSPGANQLLKTNASGYTYTGWINTVSGSTTATPNRIYVSNDTFIRYMTLAQFRTSVADQTKFCAPATRVFNYSGTRNVNGQYSFTFPSTIGGVSLSGAKAVIVNLAVRSASNAYFVAWKYGETLPGIALVNLTPNVFGNVQATIPMDTSRRIRYMYGASSGNYTIFDVIGVVF